ncbi:MAG TPA: NYN domain-containing protein [bacterium]|nr:NYN domain-containing protein [bacterium]
MLIYVIDAFNLIHSVPRLSESPTPRSDLLAFLKAERFEGSRANRLVVVFDGYPAENADHERLFEVIFSKNRTADDAIREYLEKSLHPKQVVVVSDDREVRDFARSFGARPMKNEEFLQRDAKHAKHARRRAEGNEKKIEHAEEITEELEKIWAGK